ncbi:LytR/AlgR family response regulator transcription factor [Mucilaginibacter glaciei]|uniref:Response regulator transcription factor n=1 Tax=Mucilaginibacter glaciei TaxID=2772109 RepID=A0A926NPJ9_9SPHI|nr:LytTR family DNA-binding domain-containing protein [Mucilaginibacter glaciei]MBD1391545.1 response regulator transcription factor [Mucilaginibacter glaciei]
MKQLTCVAIDDEPLALNLIEEYISRLPSLKLLKTFDDAVSGSEYIKANPVDILFVDINMPDITGIELVRSLEKKPMVIFTTAYKNFAYEGYELQALDYLLKPIDFDRFNKAIEKAVDYYRYKNAIHKEQEQGSMYVYSEYRMIKIEFNEVEYIESMEDYIKIHLQSQPKPVLTLMPLKKILEKLPEDKFKRVHRSYIVALGKIKSIHNKKIQLKNAEIPVGNSYSEVIGQWSK